LVALVSMVRELTAVPCPADLELAQREVVAGRQLRNPNGVAQVVLDSCIGLIALVRSTSTLMTAFIAALGS
jgi:hypothetical protein